MGALRSVDAGRNGEKLRCICCYCCACACCRRLLSMVLSPTPLACWRFWSDSPGYPSTKPALAADLFEADYDEDKTWL